MKIVDYTNLTLLLQIPPPQYPHKYQDKLKEIEVERRKVTQPVVNYHYLRSILTNEIPHLIIGQTQNLFLQLQKENEAKYNTALVEMKDELREKEGEEIAEKLKGKIREWFQTEQ